MAQDLDNGLDNENEIEVDLNKGGEIEIDIVDDTPAADKGRKPATEEADPTEEELDKYSGDTQKRIKKLTRGYHDERRAKESATRERDEAVAFAQRQLEMTKQLQRQLSSGSEQLISTTKSAADFAMEAAKREFKEAYESGDPEKIADAQDKIAEARYKKELSANLRPLQYEENQVYNIPKETNVPRPDSRALEWQEENSWFGSDDEMTSFALGLHEKLVKSGVDPKSEAYYEKVDARMRQIFPDEFGSENIPAEKETAPRAKAKSVVAPATRSTAPKRIVLTATQVALAKRLGLTNEQYAHELMKIGA